MLGILFLEMNVDCCPWEIKVRDEMDMDGGIDGRAFLSKTQKEELKAKYEELKA